MFFFKELLIYLSVITINSTWGSQSPVIKISSGELSGTIIPSSSGRQIYTFYGIPYAAPPVLKLRFKEPQPVKPWIGTWNASLESPKCAQYDHVRYALLGNEDCLYMNVFSTKLPTSNSNPNLDVLVFIHGGAFMFGSSNIYGPEYLLDSDDIVLATFNYRLGALGFLSTGDDVVPGNNGLKDQVAALRWVQKNIAAFGGNPKSVTLIGNSAGGASVQYHYLSPQSDGLFHRGISQSGTPLNAWALSEQNDVKSRGLAANLGCPTHESIIMVECLRSRTADSILWYSQSHLQGWRYNPFSPWGPSIELNSSRPFLDEDPYKLLERGQVKDLPWLLTYTSDEGLYPVGEYAENFESTLDDLNERWEELAPLLLDYLNSVPSIDHTRISREIRQLYFANNSISTETYKEVIAVVGDRLFAVGIQQAARLQAAANRSPVYLLHFAAPIKKSLSTLFTDSDKSYGVSHADDLAYVFKTYWGEPTSSAEDWALSRLLTNIFISFAKNEGVPVVENVHWKPVSRSVKRFGDLDYVRIRGPKHVEALKQRKFGNYDFWTSLGFSTY